MNQTSAALGIPNRFNQASSRSKLFEAFAQAYQAEANRLAQTAVAARAGLEGRLAAVERKIAGLVRAIEDGLYQPVIKERMATLEAEKHSCRRSCRPGRSRRR